MFPSLRRVAVAADLIVAETRIYILYYNAGGRNGYGGLRVPTERLERARAHEYEYVYGETPLNKRPVLIIDLLPCSDSALYIHPTLKFTILYITYSCL